VIDPPSPAHQDALAALAAWVAPDEAQEALRERYCAVLRTRPDAVDRSGRPEHLTASALVLSYEGDRVLLGLHRKVGRWLQMGGHLEAADRSLAGAALREAQEESGVDGLALLAGGPVRLDAHPVRCAGPAEPERVHLDVQYAAVAPRDAVEQLSEESIALAWYAVDALPPDTDDSVRRLVSAALRRRAGADQNSQSPPSPTSSAAGSVEAAGRADGGADERPSARA
jgi:8-oxo-dGTP pyrophosphatase MutT (NUDIX family)